MLERRVDRRMGWLVARSVFGFCVALGCLDKRVNVT